MSSINWKLYPKMYWSTNWKTELDPHIQICVMAQKKTEKMKHMEKNTEK